MRLALQSQVMAALGLANLPDYNNAVSSALEFATLGLENVLRTEFELTTTTDYFEPNVFEPLRKLRLKRGFVLQGPTANGVPVTNPQVIYAASPWAMKNGNTVDITSMCVFDYEKGVVWVRNLAGDLSASGAMSRLASAGYYGLPGSSVSVSYSAGFPVSKADPTLFDLTIVPDWLQQLAQMRAQINLAQHPAIDVTKAVAGVSDLQSQFVSVVARKTRYTPDAILSVN